MHSPAILLISVPSYYLRHIVGALTTPTVSTPAVPGYGPPELKATLGPAIPDESNRLATPDIVHRPLDGHHRVREEDEFIFEPSPMEEDADYEEAEDLRSISPDAWGEDFDFDIDDDTDE